MCNRKLPYVADPRRKGAFGSDANMTWGAFEAKVEISGEGTWEHADLGEDLKAIADAEDVPAAVGVVAKGGDDGASFGEGSATKVVAVAKSAWDGDEIGFGGEGCGGVPDHGSGNPADIAECVDHFGIGIGAREHDDGGAHGAWLAWLSKPNRF
jgi:hypothetical protein